MITLEKYDHRIPAWNSMKLINRNCPFCGCLESKKVYTRPDQLTVVLCKSCDTHYVSPGPTEESIDNFYKSYYGNHANYLKINGDKNKKINKSDIYEDVRINVLAGLIDISKAEVLDVGCGNGEFLLSLKFLGARVTGIDLSQDAVKAALANGVDRVINIALSDLNDDVKYDLIILNDVIEHPLEPIKLFEKAVNLLKVGGLLLIWTPNNDYIFLDSEKKTLRVDLEHMQYLGSRACKHLSVRLNIDLVHYESLGYCTYLQGRNKNIVKKIFVTLLKIFFIYEFVKKIYKLVKFKNDRFGNYHLFVIFKK